MKATKSRIISVFLAFVMMLSVIAVPDVFRDTGLLIQAEATTAQRMVEIARGEVGNGGTTYQNWMGMPGQPWCAMFTSWVANQAGIGTNIIPRTASTAAVRNFAQNNNRLHGPTTVPRVGDIAVWHSQNSGTGGSGHVNIVIGVNGNNVTTIGGNEGGRVSQHVWNWRNNVNMINPNTFRGWFRPNYQTIPAPTAPTLNAFSGSFPVMGGVLRGTANFFRYEVLLNLWCATCQQLLFNQVRLPGSTHIINGPVATISNLSAHRGCQMDARLFHRNSGGVTQGNSISFRVAG